jgi:hypothetical protein
VVGAIAAFIVWIWFAGAVASAQIDRGSVSGIVTDPNGSRVVGAKVTITNAAMGTQNSTVTTGAGDYTIPDLPAGIYSVTVVAPGFSTLVRNGITVSVGETAAVDLKLAVGQGTTSITVMGDAPLLQTDSPQNNIEVSTTDMNELPFNVAGIGSVRDPMSFAALAPGTIVGGWNDIHISGSPATTYRVFMDGLDDTSAVKGAISDENQPSVESLASQELLVNNYSAEFGESAGGIFNYTSKSGSNKLHGTVFNYLENEDLDAGQPFNYTTPTSNQKITPVQRQLDFGGSFGGPVVIPHVYNGHNKTFFFFAYEEYHNAQTLNNGTITVPTTAYRNGDLSALLAGPIMNSNGTPMVDCLGRTLINGAVYNPNSTSTCPDGTSVRNPFPNNNIGAPSTWDPVAQAVLPFIPTPSGATANALNNNYPNDQPNNKFQYLTSIKIDHSIGEQWHVSGYYIAEQSNKDNAADGINGPAAQTRWNTTPAPQVYLNADYTATPRLVLHAGFDYTEHIAAQDAFVQNFQASSLGLNTAANMPGGAASTFPIIHWSNQNNDVNHSYLQQLGNNNAPFIDHNWSPTGSATWIHGSHTFKFGGDLRHQIFGTHNDLSAGSYGFDSSETSLPSTQGNFPNGANLGDGFASFALGLLNNANIGNDNIQWFHRLEGGIYATDTWKLTSKFTVNYGLRWDLEQMQHEQHDRETQFGPNVANPSAGGLLGGTEYEGYGPGRCNCNFEKFYPWMIQPRLGINYQLDAKTVIHVGAGFYSGQQLFMNEINYSNQGFGFNQVFLNSPSYGISAGQFSNGIPYSPAALTATNFDPGAYPGPGSIQSPPPYSAEYNGGRPARFFQTTFGIEREIVKNLSVEASFIDNRGVWLESDGLKVINQLPVSVIAQHGLDVTNPADQALLTSSISSPAVAARGFTAPYAGFPSGQTLAQALRPYPQFGNINDQYERDGNTWYDALQVKVTKRMSAGLSAGLGYSWSKDLGTVSSTGTYTTSIPIQDPTLSPKSQKTFLAIDQPQMLNFNFDYVLPRFGFAHSGWKAALLSGWTTDGIFHYQSGFPMQVPNAQTSFQLSSVTFTSSNNGNGVFANRVAGQPLFLHNLNSHSGDPRTTFFLNPAAWTSPAAGSYSTSKPYFGDYRAPRYPSEQLGFGKVVDFKEGVRFSVRADFFNVFNRWAYPGLNNTGNFSQAAQYNSDGSIANGFGYLGNSISGAGGNFSPRTGEIVARIQF